MVLTKLKDIIQAGLISAQYSSMTQQIFDYVHKNLQDSNLSLKGIAENHLFMNVDYVSKKFYRETRQKVFPLPDGNEDSACKGPDENQSFCIHPDLAMQIGCGNNPKYFSQLFKKQEGITPTEYMGK